MSTTTVGEEGTESDNSADTSVGEEGGVQWITGDSSVPVLCGKTGWMLWADKLWKLQVFLNDVCCSSNEQELRAHNGLCSLGGGIYWSPWVSRTFVELEGVLVQRSPSNTKSSLTDLKYSIKFCRKSGNPIATYRVIEKYIFFYYFHCFLNPFYL